MLHYYGEETDVASLFSVLSVSLQPVEKMNNRVIMW